MPTLLRCRLFAKQFPRRQLWDRPSPRRRSSSSQISSLPASSQSPPSVSSQGEGSMTAKPWNGKHGKPIWKTHKNTISHSVTIASEMTVFGTFDTKTAGIRLRPFCRDSLGKAKTKRQADCLEQHFFAECRTVLGCLGHDLFEGSWKPEAEISWDCDPQVLSSCLQNHPLMKGALPNLHRIAIPNIDYWEDQKGKAAKQATCCKAPPPSLRRLHGQRTKQLCFQYSSQNGAHGRADASTLVIFWMGEILQELVDCLSRYHPSVYCVSELPVVTNSCQLMQDFFHPGFLSISCNWLILSSSQWLATSNYFQLWRHMKAIR